MKVQINSAEELRKAWDWCWENRREGDHFLSATDIHRRVRAAVAEKLAKKPYGSFQYDTYMVANFRCSITFTEVRRFLFEEARLGRLRADNPRGRNTSTGMRFRPSVAGLTPAEIKAQNTPKEERSRVRFIRHKEAYAFPLVAPLRKLCDKRATAVYRGYRAQLRVTNEIAKVTCKKCLALLAKTAGLEKGSPAYAIHDKILELPQPSLRETYDKVVKLLHLKGRA